MSKYSQWFPAEIKPVWIGVYRVRHASWATNYESWAHWNGVSWSNSTYSKSGYPCPPIKQFDHTNTARIYQDKIWRGLTRKTK